MLSACRGCDQCGLRCSSDVPATQQEWSALQEHIAALPPEGQDEISVVEKQDKTYSLGDDVTVQMCRYRDMDAGRCMVYQARPLVCRLLGHVEWMPCPIDKVPRRPPVELAVELITAYVKNDRKTFEEWEAETV